MTQTKAIAAPAPSIADWFVPPIVVPLLMCVMILVLGMMP
jgi:hypothetical protein